MVDGVEGQKGGLKRVEVVWVWVWVWRMWKEKRSRRKTCLCLCLYWCSARKEKLRSISVEICVFGCF